MWKLARVVKAELETYRDSLLYVELSTFVGCVLASLLQNRMITLEEERRLRRYMDDKT